MGDWRLFVLVLLVALNKHSYCLDWSGSPKDNDVLSVCVGDDVTFPWDFLTAPNEGVKDIKWQYETNSTSKLIAFYSSGVFETSANYSKRVSYESNGSVTMTDVTMKDSGMYSISFETQDQNGVGRYQTYVALQVKDIKLTEDRKVHVRQEGGAKWDNTTSTFTLTLSCGTFQFTDQQPSLQVEWTTPTGDKLNSTDYSDGRFYLSLLAPVVEGTYTCRIPPQHLSHTCLTDSRHGNDFVRVDSNQINVLQTVFEQKTFTEENEKLKDRIANLDAEDENLKAENEKLKAKNEKLKAEQEQFEADADKIKDQNRELQSAVDKLKEEDGKLNVLLSRMTKVIADIDKCPRSWKLLGESCYKYISIAATWQNAQVECETMGAGLVEIDSQAENSFVFTMVTAAGAEYAWLGLSDVGTEGLFLLPSGQPPTFTKWQPGEPNDYGGREDCVMFRPGKPKSADGWNDASCDKQFPFVCEQHVLF
ncbi:uncharacterized protein [Littorina saxatilis]|uniref:VIgL family C-type lectin-related protein n=1 Tax=Littorina saxatilis TaxID=31220 RepID=A0AAN9AX24_9CAEN